MTVAIIDYDAGNLTSVARALRHLGCESVISADPAVIAAAERIIFPGVGAAGSCMASLRARGLDRALAAAVAERRPVLGICVGMQLLFTASDEDGGVPCLGVLAGQVRRFLPQPGCKIPHMGWNPVSFAEQEPLARGIPLGTAFYFVHSYHCVPEDPAQIIATSEHGIPFCAGLRQDNLVAVQFHPEKSGAWGLQFLRNFLALEVS